MSYLDYDIKEKQYLLTEQKSPLIFSYVENKQKKLRQDIDFGLISYLCDLCDCTVKEEDKDPYLIIFGVLKDDKTREGLNIMVQKICSQCGSRLGSPWVEYKKWKIPLYLTKEELEHSNK